ncbi:MAG: hypothetical protein K2H07_01065 [Lachnospiraceae bacterium]|nr:hypothetical protein [Lachnospiraceae bacterium]
MKKIMRKAITAVVCAMLLVGTMGMTALAAYGGISGSLKDDVGTVTMQNTSGTTRKCYLTLREYNGYNSSNYNIVSSNSGTISSGNTISTSGKITKEHAKGVGLIYNSSESQSGVASTLTTQIK